MSKKKTIGVTLDKECKTCQDINWLKKDFAFHNPRKLTQEEKESLSTLSDELKTKLFNNVFGTEIEYPTENILKSINKKLNLLASYEN